MPERIILANQNIAVEDGVEHIMVNGQPAQRAIKVLVFQSPEAGPFGPLREYRVPMTSDFARDELAPRLVGEKKVDVFRTLPGPAANGHHH